VTPVWHAAARYAVLVADAAVPGDEMSLLVVLDGTDLDLSVQLGEVPDRT